MSILHVRAWRLLLAALLCSALLPLSARPASALMPSGWTVPATAATSTSGFRSASLEALPNGTLVATWLEAVDSASHRVMTASQPAGGGWSVPAAISGLFPAIGNPPTLASTAGPNSSTLVAWVATGNQAAYALRSAAGTWTTEAVPDPAVSAVTDVAIAADGTLYLAALSSPELVPLVVRRPSGGSWEVISQTFPLTNPVVLGPRLAAGTGSSLYAVWAEQTIEGATQILSTRWDGTSWSDPETVVNSFDPSYTEPTAITGLEIVFAGGTLHAAWVQNRDVAASDLGGQGWTEPANLTNLGTLTLGSGWAYLRELLADSQGNLTALWAMLPAVGPDPDDPGIGQPPPPDTQTGATPILVNQRIGGGAWGPSAYVAQPPVNLLGEGIPWFDGAVTTSQLHLIYQTIPPIEGQGSANQLAYTAGPASVPPVPQSEASSMRVPSSGASTIYLPLIMRDNNGWNTPITVRSILSPAQLARAQAELRQAKASQRAMKSRWEALKRTYRANRTKAARATPTPTPPAAPEGTLEPTPPPTPTRASAPTRRPAARPQAPPQDPTVLTIRFYRNDGSFTAQFTLPLQTGGTLTFDPRDLLALPPGWVGSAVISSSLGDIIAAVQEERLGWDALGYSAVTAGAPSLRLPLIFKAYNSWRTGVEVQNLGSVATTVTIDYVRQDGATFSEQATIQPLASATFEHASLPAGFLGSAVVRSSNNQPLAVTVNEVNSSSLQAMAYLGLSTSSSLVTAPLVFLHYFDYSSGIAVQNAGEQATNITVNFRARDTGTVYTETQENIAPGALAAFDQRQSSVLPAGFLGSAIVTSGPAQPLVGIVNEVKANTSLALVYEAATEGNARLEVPYLVKNLAGWRSGVQIQNLGGNPAQFTMRFFNLDGSLALEVSDTVPAQGSVTYEQAKQNNLPNNWQGSATITSNGGQLAAIVNYVR